MSEEIRLRKLFARRLGWQLHLVGYRREAPYLNRFTRDRIAFAQARRDGRAW